MATLLHTADIHLQKHADERWQALETLLDTATKLKVDAVTIGGDLFDQNINAQNLRDKLRSLFSQQKFQIIILPGNHDLYSFEAGLYFGDNVTILADINQQIQLDNKTTITGIPFEPLTAGELSQKILHINDRLDPEQTNILLFHGELTDIFFNSSDFGDEGQKRYLPLKLNLLADTNFDYLLAGHFHTKFHLKRLPNQRMKQGGFFVYPGSPVSITTKEIGKRKVALIKPGQTPQEITLESYHYQQLNLQLAPSHDATILENFAKELKSLDKNTIGLCQVTGFFDQTKLKLTEEELKAKLDNLVTKNNAQMKEEDFSAKDIGSILDSGLYQAFNQELAQTKLDKKQRQILTEKLIEALIQANS
jgi:DNA repair protein SbcD/Mre11